MQTFFLNIGATPTGEVPIQTSFSPTTDKQIELKLQASNIANSLYGYILKAENEGAIKKSIQDIFDYVLGAGTVNNVENIRFKAAGQIKGLDSSASIDKPSPTKKELNQVNEMDLLEKYVWIEIIKREEMKRLNNYFLPILRVQADAIQKGMETNVQTIIQNLYRLSDKFMRNAVEEIAQKRHKK